MVLSSARLDSGHVASCHACDSFPDSDLGGGGLFCGGLPLGGGRLIWKQNNTQSNKDGQNTTEQNFEDFVEITRTVRVAPPVVVAYSVVGCL